MEILVLIALVAFVVLMVARGIASASWNPGRNPRRRSRDGDVFVGSADPSDGGGDGGGGD